MKLRMIRNLDTPADRAWWTEVLDAADQGEWIRQHMEQLEQESKRWPTWKRQALREALAR